MGKQDRLRAQKGKFFRNTPEGGGLVSRKKAEAMEPPAHIRKLRGGKPVPVTIEDINELLRQAGHPIVERKQELEVKLDQ